MAISGQKMGALEWTLLIVLSMLWGSSFIFIELALKGLSPFFLVFLRVFIGAVALTAILAVRGIFIPTDFRLWRFCFIMAVLQNAVPFSLISWGQQYVSAGLTSILNGATPIFAVILAHFFTQNEKLTIFKGIGVALGIFGIANIIGLSALKQMDLENLGQIAILGAAFCYGLSIVWGLKFSGLKPGVAPACMLWCASLMLLPVLWLDGGPWIKMLDVTIVGSILSLGVLCSAVAYILFFHILERGGASNTSLVTFLIPVSTLVLAFLFLGQRLSYEDIPGVMLIFVGVALVDGGILSFVRNRLGKRKAV